MQGLIDIEPKQYLDFLVDEDNKLVSTKLLIMNLTSQLLTYKIKTTQPTLFQVRPSIDTIQPNQQVTVDISITKPVRFDSKLEAKFQINASVCESSEIDLQTFWKTQDPQYLQSVQVKSRLKQIQQQQQPQNEEFQEVIKEQDQSLLQQSQTDSNMTSAIYYQSIMDQSQQQQQQQQSLKDEEIQRCQEQLEKLQKELSDYQLMLKSVKQQEVAVKHHGNKFELKQVLIMAVISLVLGFIFGK